MALFYDPNIVRVLLADARILDVPRDARCAHRRFGVYSSPSYVLLRLVSRPGSLPAGIFSASGELEFEAQLGPVHAFRGEVVLIEIEAGWGAWCVGMVETQAQALARAESEILRLVAKPSSQLH